jgi:transposase
MLDTPASPANAFAFPVAESPLSSTQRDALLPRRLGPAWLLAQTFDRLVASLDLSCLAPLYRGCGSLPYSPLLLLELALFCIADGLPSPKQWADMANRDGPTRWLVHGIEPSCSTCYAFRDRLGDDCLLELNRQVLALARQQQLTSAASASIDGTSIEAAASRHHLLNAPRLEQGVQLLEEPASAPDAASPAQPPQQSQPLEEPRPDASTQPVAKPKSTPDAASQTTGKRPRRPVRPGRTQGGRKRQQQRWKRAQQELKRRQERNAQKRASKRTAPEKMVISPTDSEAAVGRDKRGVFRPLYNAQLVADVDSDLILGYEVFAQQNDSGLLGAMLDRTERLLGHKLVQALVDGSYVGGQDLAEAEARGVEIIGPIAAEAKTKQLPKSAFGYEAQNNRYVCPEGKALEQVGQSRQKRSSVELVVLKQYQNTQGACEGCPRKQECCAKSKGGRTISRSEHEESVDRLKERMSQAENKKRYKRRAATVERLFGDGKENRGMNRVRGRGLSCARIQLGLTVLQHNLRVLGQAAPSPALPPGESGSQDLAA